MTDRPRPGTPLPGSPLPGDFVRHPDRPDWGLGQVQSTIGHRVTVNFENAGKVLINTERVTLETVDPDAET